ncbi:Kunitz-type serine protease inhibitor [Elysia marginata]|uniref:Kunitz-type serine protease inhibitor n=1 Tax=Elysia marginata TaxID=1093978 RepID=A0AAV4ENV9_9GAST|nr:Kunitz-type serine protease inhibitor [Elysia marginata]
MDSTQTHRLCGLAVKTLAQRSGGTGSIHGRVKPRTLKLVLVADPSGVWHYGFSAKSGRLGVHAADFIFGGEAKRVCKAYKMICPSGKVCALQSITWPRTMKFPVCVHERKIVVKSRLCRKPPQPGKCGAQFVRWYFNVHMGACSWFTYSGCGGNRNNFRTAAECEARCVGGDSAISTRPDRRRQRKTDVIVQEGGKDDDSTSEDGGEPITAPARAAQDLDLDVTNSRNGKNNREAKTKADLAEEKRRRKELRRKARKERRRRKKELEKRRRASRRNHVISWRRSVQVTTPRPPVGIRRPSRKLTLLELGPNYGLVTASPSQPASWSSSASSSGRVVISTSDDQAGARGSSGRARDSRGYLEARGRGVTRYDPDRGKDRPIWLMDELLKQDEARRAERRRRRRRNRHNRRRGGDGRRTVYREGASKEPPKITITVRSYPTSSRLPPSRSSVSRGNSHSRSSSSSSRTPRYSYNQSQRPRDSPYSSASHVRPDNLADAPTSSEDTPTGGGPAKKKQYYDKIELFNILEDRKDTMKE